MLMDQSRNPWDIQGHAALVVDMRKGYQADIIAHLAIDVIAYVLGQYIVEADCSQIVASARTRGDSLQNVLIRWEVRSIGEHPRPVRIPLEKRLCELVQVDRGRIANHGGSFCRPEDTADLVPDARGQAEPVRIP